MSHPVITVEGLSKAYRIGLKEEIPDTLVGAATSWLRAPLRNFQNLRKLNTFSANGEEQPDIVWALRDVSFEVVEGEVLGIIGRNGAGKSTLLKILSRITEPTRGRAIIRGRVSSLLEVGTGFHPELSGRENIYMNGTILGMRKKEIDRKLDQIIDFSGVEKFLDTAIKRYSSGMKVRLAFSVAAHLEPEILIIDEVLAVGDAEFQKKCLGKMQDVASGGRTVLFVSHNMPAVECLCDRAMLLRDGAVQLDGETDKTITAYLEDGKVAHTSWQDLNSVPRLGNHVPVFRGISLKNHRGDPVTLISSGEKLCIGLEIDIPSFAEGGYVAIGVDNTFGQRLFTISPHFSGETVKLRTGCNRIQCVIPELLLNSGRYFVTLGYCSSNGVADHLPSVLAFDVEACDFFGSGRVPKDHSGPFLMRSSWSLVGSHQMDPHENYE